MPFQHKIDKILHSENLAEAFKTGFFTLLVCFNSLVTPLTTLKIVVTGICHRSDLRTPENSATAMEILAIPLSEKKHLTLVDETATKDRDTKHM